VRTDEDNTLVVLHARSMLNPRTHSPMRADNRTIILLSGYVFNTTNNIKR